MQEDMYCEHLYNKLMSHTMGIFFSCLYFFFAREKEYTRYDGLATGYSFGRYTVTGIWRGYKMDIKINKGDQRSCLLQKVRKMGLEITSLCCLSVSPPLTPSRRVAGGGQLLLHERAAPPLFLVIQKYCLSFQPIGGRVSKPAC